MSRTVPGARHEWPYNEAHRQQGYGGGQDVPGPEYGDMTRGSAQEYGSAGYGPAYAGGAYDGQPDEGHDYDGTVYDEPGYNEHGFAAHEPHDQAYYGQSYGGQQAGDGQGYAAHGYPSQGYPDQGYPDQGYPSQGYPSQGYPSQGYPDQAQGHPARPTWRQEATSTQTAPGYGPQGQLGPLGPGEQLQGFQPPQRQPGRRLWPRQRTRRFQRLRRFARRPTVRVVGALFGIFLIWVMFSAGQAAFKNNGQGFTANLAEWARDHYLGPIITFGEWITYQPPSVGGKPSFAYTVPKGEQITAGTKGKGRHHGFVPDIPPAMKSLASGPPLSGEGQWRVVEKVKGQPAILITFLRDATYTAYSSGIASIDQRLVRFSLRPGSEDPGSGNWGVPDYIPPHQRTGLLATFNGGFKLDSARGGWYLHGVYHGSLVNGAASVV